MDIGQDFGQTMSEKEIKEGLLKLNSNFVFDPGGRLNMYHPQIGTRQGVYLGLKHLCALERGAAIPEYNVWGLVKDTQTGEKRKSHIVRVGWRHTFQVLVDRRVPGVTWDSLHRVFNMVKKDFVGEPMMLDVARM